MLETQFINHRNTSECNLPTQRGINRPIEAERGAEMDYRKALTPLSYFQLFNFWNESIGSAAVNCFQTDSF